MEEVPFDYAARERWRIILEGNSNLATPWSGHIFRFASLRYLRPEDILSGEGSRRNGGRWNAPGSAAAVYGSLTKATAATELDAKARYYGLSNEALMPTILVAIEIRLQAVLDLRSGSVLKALQLNRKNLENTDWRADQLAGRESITQALGRVAWAVGLEGLLTSSAQVPGGSNLIYFPQNVRSESSHRIANGEELRRLL